MENSGTTTDAKSTIRAKPNPRCYQLFEALANSDGNNTALSSCATGVAILDADPAIQAGVVMVCLEQMESPTFHYSFSRVYTVRTICSNLLTKPLKYSHAEILYILDFATRSSVESHTTIPTLGTFVDAVENHILREGLSEDIVAKLVALADKIGKRANTNELKKLMHRVKTLSLGGSQETVAIVAEEAWSDVAIADLHSMDADERSKWDRILCHSVALTSTEPSKKWLTQAKQLLNDLGAERFQITVMRWFPLIGKKGSATIPVPQSQYEDHRNELISPPNVDLLKGLAWFCSFYQDDDMARLLGDAAEVCFKKVPGVGARCPKLANACAAVLSSMTFKEAVAQLSRLKTGAKNASSRKQLDKSLGNAAQRSGMTVADLEEISVPEYGFTEVGKFLKQLGDYQAQITISGARSAEVLWTDNKGRALNSVPAAVKRDFADDVKMLKKVSSDIEKLLPSVRYRIESSLLQQRHWQYNAWRERYLDHPICGAFARKLLWNFNGKAGIWLNGNIVNLVGNPLALEDMTLVELWHPIGAAAADVLAWRQWLVDHNVTQPFKQAHREIYVLTDAERQTGTYSNRFAAHIIRQHQFAELAKQRGWRYTLQGGWDSANTPELLLPQWDLRVEFWVDPALEENTTETGIYVNIATDQVRFSRLNTRDLVNLTEIMPIVFTEVMRDVDLFIGVCSIGNDPTWQDGGRHHDYWQSYSFGDLSATAQTRKSVLKSIIPHLRIGSRCSFSDKFLVVKGDLRTYNIHLGSGNILMEPNGQYLCIVPSRGDKEKPDDVFLPFEGDRTMSIILSKCFLLAEDSKIKDPTILRQIQRK